MSSPAIAAGEAMSSVVNVRGSDKPDYSRIVVDWGQVTGGLPAYTAQETNNHIILTFSRAGSFPDSTPTVTALSRVAGYKILAPDKIEIDYKPGLAVRHFVIDHRVVIDIRGHLSPSEATKEHKSDLPVNLVSKIESAAGDAVSSHHPDAIKNPDEKHILIDTPKTDPVAPSQMPSSPGGEAAVAVPKTYKVSITSTTSIPLSVFERNGYLWVVEGKEDIKIPPMIAGADKRDAPMMFESVPTSGASVFRVKIPDGMAIKSEGKGLAWTLYVSDHPMILPQPVRIKREFPSTGENSSGKGGASLLWPAQTLNRIVEIKDPDAGDLISTGLVEAAQDFSGAAQHFVDVDLLPSYVGIAAVAKVDELQISKTGDGLLFSKPGGVVISSDKDILNTAAGKSEPPKSLVTAENQAPITRVYDFPAWRIGEKKDLADNQRLMMLAMADQTDARKAETLINLARLMLSFDYAPESLGYLDLAQSLVPELENNPEFIALRAAAQTLSWNYKDAYQNFSSASLNDIGEVPYWKAYTLAKLDDWQQAAKIFPADVSILATYPEDVQFPLSLTLAEVALREGNVSKAQKILDILEPFRKNMTTPYASAFDYLTGEYARQTGKPDLSKEKWKELAQGPDDLYRAKARFALTKLQLDAKEITEDKAIDNLEGLRYAWRGDDLEVSINNNLAKVYLQKGDPVKALTLMKFAHSLNPNSEQGKAIDADMHTVFKSLFAPDKVKTISPLDTLTLYNDFSDLIPAGAEGEALTRQLAERMADADLLPRATSLLKKQVDTDLQGIDGAVVAIRLAALQTMDGRPDDALQSLVKAENFLKGQPAEVVLPKQRDIGMLRAKALSMKGKPDDAFAALALLPQDEGTLRLRADIAWRGKKWQDAADSLEQLIQKQDMSLTRPLTDDQADLLLNWAVALYLADNRYVLANLRERYSDAMAGTTKAQKFEVVTRPRQASLLSDRETINAIIDETSIFKNFLTSFKASDTLPAKQSGGGGQPASSVSSPTNVPAKVPEALKNIPGVKADDVLGD